MKEQAMNSICPHSKRAIPKAVAARRDLSGPANAFAAFAAARHPDGCDKRQCQRLTKKDQSTGAAHLYGGGDPLVDPEGIATGAQHWPQ